jgi:four helix bundle protein
LATIKQFEDLEIWQKAREICRIVYETKKNSNLKNDFKLYNQLNGSSGSIMDNIAEGFERETTKEFIRFLYISKASTGECRSQLFLAYDLEYLEEKEFNEIKAGLEEISKLLSGLIKYLKSTL